jgi:tRNA pseudouridine38-40 synthase
MEPINKYRYKLIIEYDGSSYHGFQIQNENHIKTVEGQLVKAFQNLTQSDVEIFASGRTDAGVHALAQTIHVDLPKEFSIHQLIMGVNFYLKDEEMAVIDAEIVDQNFHARFNAKMRHYRYAILNRKAPAVIEKNRVWHVGGKKLDILAMQKASEYLIGEHDFSSFRDAECQASSPIRTIENIKIFSNDDERIFVEVSAKSFLHHMVRNIVGTLVWVGKNKISVEEIKNILEAKDRSKSGPNAPSCGLYFLKTDY